MRPIGALVFGLVWTAPLPAQTAADSLHTAYHATLVALRDSMTGVRADLQLFRRDLSGAGEATVASRAARLGARCRDAVAVVGAASDAIVPASSATSDVRRATRSFRDELRAVARVLGQHCATPMTGGGPSSGADSLRAWGPYHAGQLERGLDAYHRAAARFASAVGVKLEPRIP